ncbi:hypothetical protein E2C01_079037 [Portunus trituberculatus]|uniref:Uncharacterized protein n=1 Tax=Portunus trituberculatus TaxID=210409 RepID=A0A5B7IIL8_PORTR|nr:hypothetical protein [Portunus trituberculatus]
MLSGSSRVRLWAQGRSQPSAAILYGSTLNSVQSRCIRIPSHKDENGATVVQWDRAPFVGPRVLKRTGSNPDHGPR